jgi:hypothetical protein
MNGRREQKVSKTEPQPGHKKEKIAGGGAIISFGTLLLSAALNYFGTNPRILYLPAFGICLFVMYGTHIYVRNELARRQRPKSTESGLKFQEVSPQRVGAPIPDMFTVDFGNNFRTFPRSLLEKQVPFRMLSAVRTGGEIPVRIYFDENRILRVDATVYGRDGTVGALIKANDFAILNARWDRNWDDTAFEIVDEGRVPIFQIERPRANVIRLRGIFVTSKGDLLVGTDSGVSVNPTVPVAAPSPHVRVPKRSQSAQKDASIGFKPQSPATREQVLPKRL